MKRLITFILLVFGLHQALNAQITLIDDWRLISVSTHPESGGFNSQATDAVPFAQWEDAIQLGGADQELDRTSSQLSYITPTMGGAQLETHVYDSYSTPGDANDWLRTGAHSAYQFNFSVGPQDVEFTLESFILMYSFGTNNANWSLDQYTNNTPYGSTTTVMSDSGLTLQASAILDEGYYNFYAASSSRLDTDTTDNGSQRIDMVWTAEVVPEPSTGILALLGLASLLARRRR